MDTKILLTTQEAGFADKLSSILSVKKNMTVGSVCKNIAELGKQLEDAPAQIAIVDIDSDPPAVFRELNRVIPLHPETHFTVASSSSNSEIILDAMRAGARDFILKKFISVDLDRILERILSDDTAACISLGSVVSVFSAGGGCGATTVAINLANELRLLSSKSVLAMDLENYYGGVSSYLGISGHYSVSDILNHNGPIDASLVMSSTTNYIDNFDVLLNTVNGDRFASKPVKKENLKPVLDACRQAYKYTIIDAARSREDITEVLAAASRVILVVFQMTVKDIKVTKALISKLTGLGADPENIIPLANRYRKRGMMVPLEETKKALGLSSLQLISNDFKNVVKSINHGTLLADSASRSSIRRDFQSLAARINAIDENDNVPFKR